MGEFASQTEALAAVRAQIARHGEPWAEWYMLAQADGDNPWEQLAEGAGLIRLAVADPETRSSDVDRELSR